MVRKLLAVMLLVFVAGMLYGKKDGRTGREKVIRMSMVHGCQDNAAGAGLPADKTEPFCACTIDKLIAQHGYEKLDKSFVEGPTQPSWLVSDMRSHAKQCATDMGIEITFAN